MSFDEKVQDKKHLLEDDELTSSESIKKKNWNFVIGIGAALGAIVVLGLVYCVYFFLSPRVIPTTVLLTTSPFPNDTPQFSKTFPHAAVAALDAKCSTIGKNILQKGGSVVDSAIASMLCVGLYNAQSTGIGGGSFMTVYNSSSKTATFINFRETASANANKNMFNGDSTISVLGTLAVAVPGEIAGYWKAHQLFGVLPWKELFKPSIDIAENGMVVNSALASSIQSKADIIQNRTFNLLPIFGNEDGSLKVEGDIVRRPQLAKTLRIIAEEGATAFYNGLLADDIIKDLEDGFGDNIITLSDLKNYEVKIEDALNVTIGNFTLFTPGLPAGGPVISLILNILKGYDFCPDDLKDEQSKILTYHRIVEAFRFSYAKRSFLGDDENNPNVSALAANMTTNWFADQIRSKINDSRTFPVNYYNPDFHLPEDHGTAHLSIVGPNGDAVAMTSTINLDFGCKVRGKRTGIIFNNEMDDFSSPNITNYFGFPPSPNNFIHPGHRPLSSMSPSVITEKDPVTNNQKVRMVVGAAGGSKIITSTALTILNALFFGYDAGTSVEMKRIHDQLMPNVTDFEKGFDQIVINGLEKKGHLTNIIASAGSIVQAIVVNQDGSLDAACDPRHGGFPDGF